MRCDNCPLSSPDDVCSEAEGCNHFSSYSCASSLCPDPVHPEDARYRAQAYQQIIVVGQAVQQANERHCQHDDVHRIFHFPSPPTTLPDRPAKRKGLKPGQTYADILTQKKLIREAVERTARDTSVGIEADIKTQRFLWMAVIALNESFAG